MKLTFRYIEPVGAAWSESAMGKLPVDAVVTPLYTMPTMVERDFAAQCRARNVEFKRDHRQDEVVGFVVENIDFAEYRTFMQGMARTALEKMEVAILER